MAKIRLLHPTLINKIAAGEVVERPAAALKELIENSLDAGATQIDIFLQDGGQSLICVTDNGCGLSREDLEMAVERHATSKIPEEDLFHIQTFGFRGEALPALGAVARLSLTSRPHDQEEAWTLRVEGGKKFPIEPAVWPEGTRVRVEDLFFATPARLKFMKSTQTELACCQEILAQFALSHPDVNFKLQDDKKKICVYDAPSLWPHRPPPGGKDSPEGQHDLLLARVTAILGKDFGKNSIFLHKEKENYALFGFAGLPTFHRSTASYQYFFVNGRPVKDRSLSGLVRVAYQDFLPKDRHPLVVLFLKIPLNEVDVNVHPGKTHVRFQNPVLVRSLVLSSLKSALHEAGHRASSTLTTTAMTGFQTPSLQHRPVLMSRGASFSSGWRPSVLSVGSPSAPILKEADPSFPPYRPEKIDQQSLDSLCENPLGEALAQIHNSYIVAQTTRGLILIDQHAAHERIVYEKMKQQMAAGQLAREALLIPEIIPFSPLERATFEKHFDTLKKLGLLLEPFGDQAILVREVPSLLKAENIQALIQDLADDLKEWPEMADPQNVLQKYLEAVCGAMACRSSVKAGRPLNKLEMNALLRAMETTPHSGQCNHGRPTSVELKIKDIEKLFGRH